MGAGVEQAVVTRVSLSLSLPPSQGVDEPFFSKNSSCSPTPDLSVGNSCEQNVFLGLLGQRAAGSCSAFQPPVPPSGKKYPWSGLPGRVPRWVVASLGSSVCEEGAGHAVLSRGEVGLG